MLSPADGTAGRTQDPQDGADQDENAADGRQQPHAHKQANNQQNKTKDNHFLFPSLNPMQTRPRLRFTTTLHTLPV
ncbi:hypothetical protein ACFYZ6_22460 [Streptomyces rubiginosohelvolus]|uniref:Uncharacterized protein n=1 Tax=Streptomyces rubiginosohelvolus TaxID=67362 RepID=A0ABW6EUR7_9ACTN|nr:hypothetical protein [Streptomyces sp. CS-7]MCT6777287.1 hypothetical protein [Streptomyces sp. CS-7]